MPGGRVLTMCGVVLLVGLSMWRSMHRHMQPPGGANAQDASQHVRRPLPLRGASDEREKPVPVTSKGGTTPDTDAGRLVVRPLPNCSVLFFHHLEKTGGTTLRSVLQRHAQLGEFDLVSMPALPLAAAATAAATAPTTAYVAMAAPARRYPL